MIRLSHPCLNRLSTYSTHLRQFPCQSFVVHVQVCAGMRIVVLTGKRIPFFSPPRRFSFSQFIHHPSSIFSFIHSFCVCSRIINTSSKVGIPGFLFGNGRYLSCRPCLASQAPSVVRVILFLFSEFTRFPPFAYLSPTPRCEQFYHPNYPSARYTTLLALPVSYESARSTVVPPVVQYLHAKHHTDNN
jgi:hypothetical protein